MPQAAGHPKAHQVAAAEAWGAAHVVIVAFHSSRAYLYI